MSRFIVREFLGGILIPLREVVAKLPINFLFVAFRDVEFSSGFIFGLPVPEFERLSHDLNGGFVISSRDFDRFLEIDIQMIDGTIEFIGLDGIVMLKLECIDSSQWEITTGLNEIATILERNGLKRTSDDYTPQGG
jgi:hypothetical protein